MLWIIRSGTWEQRCHAELPENAMRLAFEFMPVGACFNLFISATDAANPDHEFWYLTEKIAEEIGQPIPPELLEAGWKRMEEREKADDGSRLQESQQ